MYTFYIYIYYQPTTRRKNLSRFLRTAASEIIILTLHLTGTVARYTQPPPSSSSSWSACGEMRLTSAATSSRRVPHYCSHNIRRPSTRPRDYNIIITIILILYGLYFSWCEYRVHPSEADDANVKLSATKIFDVTRRTTCVHVWVCIDDSFRHY